MYNPKKLIRESLSPLDPILPEIEPEIKRVPEIKAVLFDIYGTLLISSTGDVGTAASAIPKEVFTPSLNSCGFTLKAGEEAIREVFFDAIESSHNESRTNGIEYPEVDILSIWKTVLRKFDLEIPDRERLEMLSLKYELIANRVWPMPNAKEILTYLKSRDIVVGIVSNAQFYTPILLETLLDCPLNELGFSADLTSWSYRLGRGKPDTELFRAPVESLRARGIKPQEILYVGNDMLNDVWTASQWGLKTALFAGDERSLRLRTDKEVVKSVKPDIILTELRQLEMVIK